MNDLVSVRKADIADAALLAGFNSALAQETEGKTLDPKKILAGVTRLLADSRHGFYIVAEVNGQVAGCLMITYEWSDWRNGVFWWVQSVYVKPEYRRQGIYRRLYNHIRDQARCDGDVCGIRLYAENDNAAAQRTYEKLGMSPANYKMYEEVFRGI